MSLAIRRQPEVYAPAPVVAIAFAHAGAGPRDRSPVFNKIKKQNGEQFAQTLRNYHNGLLEIPDLEKIVRFAGRNAAPILPYLMYLLASNDDTPIPTTTPQDPFDLLKQAGYNAFFADTLGKQNSIKGYFDKGELLCTFNDSARHQNYYIIHAVKDDVNNIKRANAGEEQRQDAYGTSVISIQIRKSGGFIKITNRYNHSVGSADNTFNSNPDNIIEGLSAALKAYFNVVFSAPKIQVPDDYILIGNQIFKYHEEANNIYYGDQAWVQGVIIHAVDRNKGDALFDGFLFDNKSKILKKIDPARADSFADDFNRDYGGNPALRVDKYGNLCLNNDTLIGAEKSRIKSLRLPALKEMGNWCLGHASKLEFFEANAVTTMGSDCMHNAISLKSFEANTLKTMGDQCFYTLYSLKHFRANALETMGKNCLFDAATITHFEANALTSMGPECLCHSNALTHFEANALKTMMGHCLQYARALTSFFAPALVAMGEKCFHIAPKLTYFEAPALKIMGDECLRSAKALQHFQALALEKMGHHCLKHTASLKHFCAPLVKGQSSRLARMAKRWPTFKGTPNLRP